MRVVILVPWRTDDGPRATIWVACRRRWETLFPDWPIYEGVSPDGPFNRSAAINDAARRAGKWDVAVIIDADVMLPELNVSKAVERARKTGRVTWAHRRWRSIDAESTERILSKVKRNPAASAEGALGPGGIERADFRHADIDLIVDKTTALSWSCCIAVRRDSWETIGGFDERFVGWGFEDSAFSAVAGGLVGWDRIEGDVLNFWHPRTPGAGKADRDAYNHHTAQALVNGRLGMRYMVALRRDHRLTDRPTVTGAEELGRDIANLRKQDAKFASEQTPQARKAFDNWWPTLEELRDGAKLHNAEKRAGSVTVVVHTGGTAENWPTRREYLQQALASLNANVSGPIVQRVIYSDWGDAAPDLPELASAFGFYVVGAGHHGYTGSMTAMWRYLAKRAKGEYIFATEDDFLYPEPVDLGPMLTTLADDPNLVQIALLRDAFYQDEKETGGILGWPEPAFTKVGENGNTRLEHRLFFTCNPSVFRRSLTDRPWPSGHHSETLFGKALLRDERVRFAFWGDGVELTKHIGSVRAGTGY